MLSNDPGKPSRLAPTGQPKVISSGFSLVEVMVVVVIIGLLLMLAVPGYQESMRKSRRADGMRDLMELVSRQERFYAQNSRYTADIETADGLNYQRIISSEGHYDLSVVLCKNPDHTDFNTCYNLLATPRGKQAEDACGILNVASTGKRGHSGSPGNADLSCW